MPRSEKRHRSSRISAKNSFGSEESSIKIIISPVRTVRTLPPQNSPLNLALSICCQHRHLQTRDGKCQHYSMRFPKGMADLSPKPRNYFHLPGEVFLFLYPALSGGGPKHPAFLMVSAFG